MSSSTDAIYSASPSSSSIAFHIAGSTGTATRNRLNASLSKQHFLLNPSTVASSSKTSLFDAVPRNTEFESLNPILARLPHQDDLTDDHESLDYLRKDGVMYTRSQLPSLDSASICLWHSLHHFRPLHADYASGYLDLTPPHPLASSSSASFSQCPRFSSASEQALIQLGTSFNWSCLPALPLASSRAWYGVLFLSVRKAGSESASFYQADRLAHEEATRSGGLIMYWYGSPNPTTGANLATCIWTSRKSAVEASKLPLHRKAAQYAAPSYERYDLVRYRLVKRAGETRLRIEACIGDDDRREQEEE
ncbi:hypothetical protein NDA11_005145 [Ustilago hordei]|uniref:Uncharacterized protein n=1 Tax=Ustilago hordei TaxID=120017 RepID=I2FN14_USTHO|nr:uncharacterized protein UHO2_05333 [Ustilago hordei]KAJ1039886.1 hypothetical protein NDA10_006798 [Ustilago hordei]KAJ1574188.1 hypothetical protein NDA12_006705 [Ustilago hordei]KAJ1574405.1 hypothetical protein NDA15_001508 [Ustilago hordei]KAJ1580369.1 hypothetical protein NDA11_005145 [Ustilago hordei]KAJ1599471.1 hypothetical protein NDA14_002733 [Ustilago hordei]